MRETFKGLDQLGSLKKELEQTEKNTSLTQKINWERGTITWGDTGDSDIVYRTKRNFCNEVKNKKK